MGLAVPDLTRFQNAEIAVGLGLDHPNGSHDFFETMKTTLLTQRSLKLDQEACSSLRVLEMATRDGAKALKLFDQVGSLEVGKAADLVVLDRSKPQLQPAGGLIDQVVTGAKANCVKYVAIAGKWQLWDFEPVNLDLAGIVREANQQQQYLLKIAGL
jgi:5-methylthioadenosine/S-adenosylhomocysteine deaminase